jgi:hypothetical protein
MSGAKLLAWARRKWRTPEFAAWDTTGSTVGSSGVVTLGTLSLKRTLKRIFIKLPLTEDGGTATRAFAEYRHQSAKGTTKRTTFDLWIVRNSSGTFVQGACLRATQATLHEVFVTVITSEPQTLRVGGTITVDTESRLEGWAAAKAQCTFYISPSGNDTTGNGTEGNPWRSITKAVGSANAAGTAYVMAEPGEYDAVGQIDAVSGTGRVSSGRTTKFVLVAKNRAVGNYGVIQSPGTGYSFILGRLRACPTGITRTGWTTAPWASVSITGSGGGAITPGQNYSVWKWTGGATNFKTGQPANPTNSLRTFAYSTAPDDPEDAPWKGIAHWRSDGANTSGPVAKWVEMVSTNQMHKNGFYVEGNDIFLKMPRVSDSGAEQDPNDFYWCGDDGDSIHIDGPDSAVYGFVLVGAERGFCIGPQDRQVVENNWVQTVRNQILPWSVTSNTFGSDLVVQHNRFQDTRYCVSSVAEAVNETWVVPWQIMKITGLTLEDGTSHAQKVSTFIEASVIFGRGCHRTMTVRRNAMVGIFDGWAHNSDTALGDDAGGEPDFYDNDVDGAADDVFERDTARSNACVFEGNRMRNCLIALSCGPAHGGPIYSIGNRSYDYGHKMHAPTDAGAYRTDGAIYKLGRNHGAGSSWPNDHPPLVISALNTWASEDMAPTWNGASIYVHSAESSIFEPDAIVSRGELGLCWWHWIDHPLGMAGLDYTVADIDYSFFVSGKGTSWGCNDEPDGTVSGGTLYSTVAAVVAANIGVGANMNLGGAQNFNGATAVTAIKAMWTDYANGDLTLTSGARANTVPKAQLGDLFLATDPDPVYGYEGAV